MSSDEDLRPLVLLFLTEYFEKEVTKVTLCTSKFSRHKIFHYKDSKNMKGTWLKVIMVSFSFSAFMYMFVCMLYMNIHENIFQLTDRLVVFWKL